MTSRATISHTAWAHTPERSNMLLLRIMAWISLRMGRRVGRAVLHLITAYFLLCFPDSRRASKNYLCRVLDRPPHWRNLYQHFFTFAATIHDRIYLVNRRFNMFDFEVHGEDTLRRLLASDKGLFLLGAHLGSFEVIRAIARKDADMHVTMVMHEENAQKIGAMLAAINPEAAQDIIGLGHVDSMLKVWERLDQGGVVGMLADRTLGNDTLYPVPILGTTANLPSGPFRMAVLLKRPVVFMTGLYLGGNRYAIHFEPLADFSDLERGQRDAALEAAIVRYAALLDQYCRMAPYNWFNFFDFWQPATATATSDSS
jgi:predicted LPLAT superfamily acyltransferase